MAEQRCRLADVELCYETFGDAGQPAMLLIMGLGTQMIAWHEDFCLALAECGFHVIRFDNRDIGRSSRIRDVPPPAPWEIALRAPRRVAYTLADMADDAVGLLDHLGVEAAHVVGASMGGMIAQVLAARHPSRVLSLASIMSMTGSRLTGQPSARVYPFLLARAEAGREAYVERTVKLFRLIGSPGYPFDEEGVRRQAAISFERGASAAGTGRQLVAILAAGNRARDLRRITAPTVVIHGSADRMVGPSGGRATVRAIRGARLVTIRGMGHDLPRGAWSEIIGAIVENSARATGASASAALSGAS